MPRARRRRLQRARKKLRIQLRNMRIWLRTSAFGKALQEGVVENAFREPLFPKLFG